LADVAKEAQFGGKMRKFITITLPVIFSLFFLTSQGSATAANSGSLTVINQSFDTGDDIVPADLKWSKKALLLAQQVQQKLYDQIKTEIDEQIKAGAVRLKRTAQFSDSGVSNWNKLPVSPNLYGFDGYNKKGKLVRSSGPFFSESHDIGVRTVYLGQNECMIGASVKQKTSTKALPECKIAVEPAAVYLRYEMQSFISLVGGFTPDSSTIEYEINKVISSGQNYKVTSNQFICVSCGKLSPFPLYKSFPLEYKFGTFPYKLTYNASKKTFKLVRYAPNWTNLMDEAYLENPIMMRFDNPKDVPWGLFPAAK